MKLPHPTDLRRAAGIFRALAHPHRVLLACCLANGRSATQAELLEQLGWPQSSLARHVGVLRERGLLRATRHGNHVLLELDDTVTPQLLAAVCHWVHPDTGDRFATAFPGTARARA
jgi:DNA-binding transcriptional ArsR family regulator